jgi:hypothetical protein
MHAQRLSAASLPPHHVHEDAPSFGRRGDKGGMKNSSTRTDFFPDSAPTRSQTSHKSQTKPNRREYNVA